MRFAPLNSEAGAAATPLPRGNTEPANAADPDMNNDNENENENDNENDIDSDNESDNNDDNENVEKPKRGKHKINPVFRLPVL